MCGIETIKDKNINQDLDYLNSYCSYRPATLNLIFLHLKLSMRLIL